MNAARCVDILRQLHKGNPEPRAGLTHTTPFELLTAVILSAQTTDVGVNKATACLYPAANTPETIHALGAEGLSEYIRTIGLYNSKAENVIETCRILIEEHGGQVLDNHEDLEALLGVGRKAANVVSNTTFRQLATAADTHIFRVANHTDIASEENVLEVKKRLLKFVPREYLLDAHH